MRQSPFHARLPKLWGARKNASRTAALAFAVWALPACLLVLGLRPASADQNWDGDNPIGNFSFANNWFGNTVGGNSGFGFGNGSLHFTFRNNSSQGSIFYDFAGYADTNDIFWDSTFGAGLSFDGNGQGLNFNQRLQNDSSFTQTIGATMNLSGAKNGATQIELNPVNGNIVFNGTMFNDNSKGYKVFGANGKTLTLNSALGVGAAPASVSFTIDSSSNNNVINTAAQTWTGATAINGGSFTLGAGGTSGSLATGSAISIASGARLIFNRSDTITQGTNFSTAAISGAGSVTQAGSGTTTLNAANTYTGGTNINAGVLNLGVGQSGTGGPLGGNGTVGATIGIIKFGSGGVGGTLQYSALNQVDYSSRFSTATGQAFSIDTNGQAVTFASSLQGAGNTLTKLGAGTLSTSSSSNSYTGTTTITNGTLQIGIGATAGALSTSSAIVDNSILAFNQTDTVTQGTEFSGSAITGSGSIVQAGTGTLVLNAANSFAGGVSINAGSVSVATVGNSGANSTLGTNGTINIGATTVGGTLVYTGTGETSDKVINLAGTTGGATITQSGASGLLKFGSNLTATGVGAKTLTLQGSTAGTGEISGNIVDGSGTTSVTKTGTGTWTLSGTNTYTGGTTLSTGTLAAANNSAFGSAAITVNTTGTAASIQSSSATNRSFSNDLIFSLNTGNTKTLTLGSALTGNLAFGAYSTAGTGGTRTVAINNLLTTFTNFTATDTLITSGTGALLFTGTNTGTAAVTIGNSNIVGFAGGVPTTGTPGNISVSNGGVLGTNGTMIRAVGASGTLKLGWTGSGGFAGYGTNAAFGNASNNLAVKLNNSNTALIFGSTTAFLGSGQALVLGNAFANGTVDFQNSLDFNTATQTVQVDRSTLAATSSNPGAAVDGQLSGALTNGGLTKTGAGILAVTGNSNTYGSGTAVNAGTLLVNNTANSGTGSGAVTVNNSGTVLGGTGTIISAVNISSSASVSTASILQGGNGTTGTSLKINGALTLNDNSVIQLALGPAGGTDHSTLARLGGAWVFDANQAFNFTGNPAITSYDNIITGLTGSETGLATIGTWTFVDPGFTGTFSYDGAGGVDLNLTAVPEPSTWAAGLLAIGGVAFMQRRRLQKLVSRSA